MSAIGNRSPEEAGLSWTSGQAIDCLLAPQQWCDHQWAYFTSAVDAENYFGDVISRIALFVPLILATVFAALSRVVHGALTACCSFQGSETSQIELDRAILPPASDEISIQADTQAGATISIGPDRAVLLNGQPIFTKLIGLVGSSKDGLKVPLGARIVAVRETTVNPSLVRFFSLSFHRDAEPDLPKAVTWEMEHFDSFNIILRPNVPAYANPDFQQLPVDQDVVKKRLHLIWELGAEFIPLVAFDSGSMSGCFGLLGVEKNKVLYLTTTRHSRFCLVKDPDISTQRISIENLEGSVDFGYTEVVSKLIFAPPFWRNLSREHYGRSVNIYNADLASKALNFWTGSSELRIELPKAINWWTSIAATKAAIAKRVLECIGMPIDCSVVVAEYLFPVCMQLIEKTYTLDNGRLTVKDTTNGFVALSADHSHLLAGGLKLDLCKNFFKGMDSGPYREYNPILTVVPSFLDKSKQFSLSFQPLTDPLVIKASIKEVGDANEAKKLFVQFVSGGNPSIFVYRPKKINHSEVGAEIGQFQASHPEFLTQFSFFHPVLGIIALIGKDAGSAQEKAYYLYPGQSTFRQLKLEAGKAFDQDTYISLRLIHSNLFIDGEFADRFYESEK